MRQEEERDRAKFAKELERQTKATSAKGDGILAVLMSGGYSFDSYGRPLAVRKLNPTKLPEMVPELDIGVDGAAIRKLSEDLEAQSARQGKGRF